MLPTYVRRSRAAQRQRRSPHSRAARAARSPRLRDREADRSAIQRCTEIPRRVAVSHALPARAARADPGTLGGKDRHAPAALLPDHARRPEGARLAAPQLERVLRRAEPRGADTTCVDSQPRRAAPHSMPDWKALVRARLGPLA